MRFRLEFHGWLLMLGKLYLLILFLVAASVRVIEGVRVHQPDSQVHVLVIMLQDVGSELGMSLETV